MLTTRRRKKVITIKIMTKYAIPSITGEAISTDVDDVFDSIGENPVGTSSIPLPS